MSLPVIGNVPIFGNLIEFVSIAFPDLITADESDHVLQLFPRDFYAHEIAVIRESLHHVFKRDDRTKLRYPDRTRSQKDQVTR